MIYILKFLNYLKAKEWYHLLFFVVILYLVGSLLMVVEPETFGGWGDYSWWFLVTASTVGYGDLFPTTDLGRLLGGIVIIGGVGSIAMIIGYLAEYIVDVNKVRVKGLKGYKMKNHVVLMGYHKDNTPYIVSEIIKDKKNCKIILCTDEVDENPLINHPCVSFVKGNLMTDDVLKRAAIKDADQILIHAEDDSKSIAVLMAVLNTNHKKETNIVLTIEDATFNTHVEKMVEGMDRKVETVTDLKTPMMVQALLDSGSSDIVNQMLCNDDSAIRSMIHDGDDCTFGYISGKMLMKDCIAIGVNKQFHPPSNLEIDKGDVIYYFGRERVCDVY
jgi:voltage-gated potassium channel